jgi:hypothetical protein
VKPYIYIRRTVRRTGPKSLQLFNFFDACSSLRLHTHTHTHITHGFHTGSIFSRRLQQAHDAHRHARTRTFTRSLDFSASVAGSTCTHPHRLDFWAPAALSGCTHTHTHSHHTQIYSHRLNFSRRLRRARDAHRHTHTRALTHSLDFCRVCGRFKLHTPTQA